MEYVISYSSKTFNGFIRVGVMTIESDSIETVKENAFSIVMERYREDMEDSDIEWHWNIQNLQVSVSEKE